METLLCARNLSRLLACALRILEADNQSSAFLPAHLGRQNAKRFRYSQKFRNLIVGLSRSD